MRRFDPKIFLIAVLVAGLCAVVKPASSRDVGAVTVSQATAANLNATVSQGTASNLKATVTTNADGTTGSAVPATGLLVQGSDGTNARNLSVTSGGALILGAGSATVGAVTQASGPWNVSGAAANGASVSGNPLYDGGYAANAERSAVSNGQAMSLTTDLVGKLIDLPYANPENFISGQATGTDTANHAVIAAQAAGVRIYVTSAACDNSSATNSAVDIKDGSTILWTLPAPANHGGATQTFPVPLRGTAATALNFASHDAVTTMTVSVAGYIGR